jgi:hypothetical protein
MRGSNSVKETMKNIPFALSLIVFQLLAAPIWAGVIKEVDYPVAYEVMDTSKTDKPAVDKSCTMVLRDRANATVTINVWRKGLGSCHVLDSGKIYQGRQNDKKNEIELVIPVGEDKARVENWRIIGTVKTNPS